MMLSNVDLPAPDGPMIVTNSPGMISSDTRRNKKNLFGPASIDFSRFRNEIKGSTPSPSQSPSALSSNPTLNLKKSRSATHLRDGQCRVTACCAQVRKIERLTKSSGLLREL